MRTFSPIAPEPAAILGDLDDLEAFLRASPNLKERAQVTPFFKQHPQLCAALGLLNPFASRPDLYATELDLFGDFACDVAGGDATAKAYTLIEFEDAHEHSIFARLEAGKTMKRYAPRFEHGFSQLVDWAWRLSTESSGSAAFKRVFPGDDPVIHLVLIAGRDGDLTEADIARLRWRSTQVSMGAYRMYAYTFDGVLQTLRDKLWMARRSVPG